VLAARGIRLSVVMRLIADTPASRTELQWYFWATMPKDG
jgi:hypothetical protein